MAKEVEDEDDDHLVDQLPEDHLSGNVALG